MNISVHRSGWGGWGDLCIGPLAAAADKTDVSRAGGPPLRESRFWATMHPPASKRGWRLAVSVPSRGFVASRRCRGLIGLVGGAQRGNERVEDVPDSSRSSPVCWASLVKCSVHRGSASN